MVNVVFEVSHETDASKREIFPDRTRTMYKRTIRSIFFWRTDLRGLDV